MTSIVAKQSLVTFVVSDPDDSELRAERGSAGNRVQGLPSIRQLEAEKVRQPAERPWDLFPPDPIAEERFPAKSDRELSEFLPLSSPAVRNSSSSTRTSASVTGRSPSDDSLRASGGLYGTRSRDLHGGSTSRHGAGPRSRDATASVHRRMRESLHVERFSPACAVQSPRG